jgi:hypothetical protein
MLRASHRQFPPILPERWAEMLRQTGAPEGSWADPSAPEKFAAAITSRVRNLVQRDRKPRDSDKARHAVAVLRRVLPGIIRDTQYWVDDYARRGYGVDRDNLDAIRRLQKNLPPTGWLSAPPSLEKAEHIDARRLLRLYRQLIDPGCGASDDGPAVKFIYAALRKMGHRPQSVVAIGRALRRKS